ncbi:hypothetical protein [Roseovarius sp.]|nr:hypothetical protein [Roseovarius sp.]
MQNIRRWLPLLYRFAVYWSQVPSIGGIPVTASLPLAALPAAPSISSPKAAPDRRAAAEKLEAVFLAEMLKSSGLGKATQGFGDQGDEDHFASFQRDILAREMVRKGGIGLAEIFFRAMAGRADE